ncbi:hypothetical protein B0H67DRAFT_554516 [Lasiosphaeris hirsuta]|uniref:Uncharacterized protein n=1 Tax=Lasiosphaeris hirsuta TaxID=260670 RepID=A0AA40AHX1_9PEZI|nr:hypothetical protein B0H67DRAFT_554516 [Lasiosphaeris hirsuta]
MGNSNSRPQPRAVLPVDVAMMRSTANGHHGLRVSTIALDEVEAATRKFTTALSGLESALGPRHSSTVAARDLLDTLHSWRRRLKQLRGCPAQPPSDGTFNRGIKLLDADESWVYATALLDTQCQIGNWISNRLVERLGMMHLISTPPHLPQACDASGRLIQARGVIDLPWKWHDPRGIRVHECQFYIFPNSTHLDVVFGVEYIVAEDLLRVNESAILPLVEHKPTKKGDKAAIAAAKERQRLEKAALAERKREEQKGKERTKMEARK